MHQARDPMNCFSPCNCILPRFIRICLDDEYQPSKTKHTFWGTIVVVFCRFNLTLSKPKQQQQQQQQKLTSDFWPKTPCLSARDIRCHACSCVTYCRDKINSSTLTQQPSDEAKNNGQLATNCVISDRARLVLFRSSYPEQWPLFDLHCIPWQAGNQWRTCIEAPLPIMRTVSDLLAISFPTWIRNDWYPSVINYSQLMNALRATELVSLVHHLPDASAVERPLEAFRLAMKRSCSSWAFPR